MNLPARPAVLTALILLALLAPLTRGAPAQLTERMSVSTAGVEADHISVISDVSLDGRYVAFDSRGSNLAPIESNNTYDVFVRDRTTGTTILISEKFGAPGTTANGGGSRPVISDDGRYVTFFSSSSDLLSSPGGGANLYRHDMLSGQKQLVSVRSDGSRVNVSPYFDASATGRYVVFSSDWPDVVPGDTNVKADVFRLDVNTGSVVRVSLDANGVQPNADCDWPTISRNGRWVAFQSKATNFGAPSPTSQVFVKDLTTGALEIASLDLSGQPSAVGARLPRIADLGRHVVFESSDRDLYAWSAGTGVNLVYVRDLAAGVTIPATIANNGAPPNNYSYQGAISADGRYAAFRSGASNLDIGANNSTYQVFVRDLLTGIVRTVSLNTAGAPGDRNSLDPALSGDGRFVVFNSEATQMDGPSANPSRDIYVRDRSAGAVFSYGAGQANSLGCVSHVTTTGTPSASAGSGFLIQCDPVRNNKVGILFYGTNGATAVPFLGGTLYVASPTRRTPLQSSGGSPSGNDCSGQFSYDFNARIASGSDAALVVGAQVCAQFWSRDPGGASNTNLSDAVTFGIGP